MKLCRDFAKDLGQRTPDASLVHLRLLATSDLHAHLMPFDYFADRPDTRIGLVRVAGLVAAARAEAPNCLLFDNGDTFQGGALGDLAARDVSFFRDGPHPMIVAMNALGYDAATLGNHDFDYGAAFLDRILADATFPVVLANAQYPGNGAPFRPRHVMLKRRVRDLDGGIHLLRIGVTGTVPPQVEQWNRTILDGALSFSGAVEATAREARLLKAAGADIVVALAHSGLGDPEPVPSADPGTAENVARRIAALPDVDVVVAGHTHEVYPPTCARDIVPPAVPMVQPAAWGSHLGCVDLAMERRRDDPEAVWTLRAADAVVLPATGAAEKEVRRALHGFLRPRPHLRRAVGEMHRATRRMTGRQIGRSLMPLHTFFSTVAPCAATQLVADAQRAAAERILARMPAARALPLISAVAPMRVGGRAGPDQFTDIPAGPLLLRHISDLYSFPNTLTILRLRGRDIPQWLERAASVFHRIDPSDPTPQPLIDHDFAGYNFDRLDGLKYDIDVSRPARTDASGERAFDTPGRIRNLRFADGRPLDPDEDLLVVTNSYRASGGGNFPVCGASETVAAESLAVRDCIVDYVAAHGLPVGPTPNLTFALCGIGRARPVVETGPGAMQHVGGRNDFVAAPLGMSPDGFLRLEYRPAGRAA